MLFRRFLVVTLMSLTLAAHAVSRQPASAKDPVQGPRSSIQLVSGAGYLLTQTEDQAEVLVPSQMTGTLEFTMRQCFDAVGQGHFKDPQGMQVPFARFGISLQAASRGSRGCSNTLIVHLPVMQEVAGTIHLEYKQAGLMKTFTRAFKVVAKDRIRFDGEPGVETTRTEMNGPVEDGKCGGSCETLIARFMEQILGREVNVYADVFARAKVGTVVFTGSPQKGEFTVRSGSFVFEGGSFEIQQKRLRLTRKDGKATMDLVYLPIQDSGRSVPTPTLYAKEKPGLTRTAYYIW